MTILKTCLIAIFLLASFSAAFGAQDIFKRAERIKQEHGKRHSPAITSSPQFQKRTFSFLTDKTQPFWVNGSSIPDVPFNIGESYAGLLPISDDPDETRKLFFWFFPSGNPAASNEIALWFNGGPGCSSLSGLLTENGPFTWEAGTLSPVQNSYSWTNLTNMMWVEQPVGVDLGLEMAGFYKQFVDTFGVQNYDVYLTGESYAGYYVPYIADAFISQNDTEYFNLKGIAINDPIIGDGTNQQQVVIAPYVDDFQNIIYLNDSFVRRMHDIANRCNFTTYLETYLTFPPPIGKFPALPDPYESKTGECAIFDIVYNEILLLNPCFNIYHITETCPHPWSVMGIINTGDYIPPDELVYFNRTDVQAAINGPVGTNWAQCTDVNVFADAPNRRDQGKSDQSLGPAQDGVFERVIEYTNNVIIGSGNLDMLLNTNGTLLAIQNMTWNGHQGLQEYPGTKFYAPFHHEYNGGSLAGAGELGLRGSERGLTFYQVQLAGHELPGYAPGAAYRSIELLLGRIKSLSDVGDFTTQDALGDWNPA
ncbi:serine carboxypeptidase [Tothia fuscella]|uniref:Carboxypeptidase n=1 Tax=Tothia fuscella TaxID=1048955 RepID=A0A9P4NEU8_9PEZI|nr:serine carboxypeptidase [Tothia fuscella]